LLDEGDLNKRGEAEQTEPCDERQREDLRDGDSEGIHDFTPRGRRHNSSGREMLRQKA
jgi:hypothetical protein